MEEDKVFTKDGSVDIHGQPADAATSGRWKACSFLLGYEVFERMAFNAIASNLVVYLTTQLHEDTVTSVRNVNNWLGSVWFTPILGAYIADSFLGRFWTFTISSLIYVLGMGLLTAAVTFKSLKPSCENGVCGKATTMQTAFFYSSLYITALGAGGTKPNISTFGADQFDDFDSNEKRLKDSFFLWWLFSSFTGSLFATVVLVYIQENCGWGLGYGIPTIGLIVSLIIFYAGTPFYRHKVRTGVSPTGDLVRVFITAFAKRKYVLPANLSELHELEPQRYLNSGKRQIYPTPNLRFLDKAAIRKGGDNTGSTRPPCTVTEVEGGKIVLRMMIIWIATLIPCTIWAQINTLFIKQGTTLDRHVGSSNFKIPAASIGSFVTISVLISMPIYDKIFVPFMQKRTGHSQGITLLQRLGIGFLIHIIAIGVSCVVEAKRIRRIKMHHVTGPKDIVPMSIFWLMPQYVLLGVGDVFNAVGLVEFFYDQAPVDMQSLGTAFFTSALGAGNFLNSFLFVLGEKQSLVVIMIDESSGGKHVLLL
uniref:Major facilitator superfamily (MFS) profile domain-containing protein n=1 Tax=Daucus carota subsp. sativus TaxID=79200 RepID=A0A161WWR0_DAUCS